MIDEIKEGRLYYIKLCVSECVCYNLCKLMPGPDISIFELFDKFLMSISKLKK